MVEIAALFTETKKQETLFTISMQLQWQIIRLLFCPEMMNANYQQTKSCYTLYHENTFGKANENCECQDNVSAKILFNITTMS